MGLRRANDVHFGCECGKREPNVTSFGFFLSLGKGGPERLLWGFAGQTTCILASNNVERENQISRRLVFF